MAEPNPPVTEVVLIRHGETNENRSRTLQGQDPRRGRLTAAGIEQAAAAGRALAGQRIDRAFCSPLERAVLTLARVLEARPSDDCVPLFFPPALREIDMGALHGKSRDDWLAAADAFGDRLHFTVEGGESWHAVQARVGCWFDEAVRPLVDERVLIVAHGGVIRGVLTHLTGQPMAIEWAGLAGGPPVGNGSICRIRLVDGAPVELTADDRRHLGAPGRGHRWDGTLAEWRPIAERSDD